MFTTMKRPEKQKLTIFYNITKNNRSFSKISISKCSDIECIALPFAMPRVYTKELLLLFRKSSLESCLY